jgi:hypothetical protein
MTLLPITRRPAAPAVLCRPIQIPGANQREARPVAQVTPPPPFKKGHCETVRL